MQKNFLLSKWYRIIITRGSSESWDTCSFPTWSWSLSSVGYWRESSFWNEVWWLFVDLRLFVLDYQLELGHFRSENTSLPMCPMLINLTESSRIDSELRGWFHAPSGPSNVHTPILNSVKPDVELRNGTPSKHELAKVCSVYYKSYENYHSNFWSVY